MKVKNKIT